ncbi:hypothetical protein ACFQAT_28170 [Undibacterium arcticum]|uniref:Transposase n=1 Tax=Undibacterium arcticum TaxID=1762892 RepID=A0ABV7F6G2_9BURK
MQLRRKDAAVKIGISLRTWISRESGNGKSGMPAQEFAMLTLFLLRSTAYWGRLANKLQAGTAVQRLE